MFDVKSCSSVCSRSSHWKSRCKRLSECLIVFRQPVNALHALFYRWMRASFRSCLTARMSFARAVGVRMRHSDEEGLQHGSLFRLGQGHYQPDLQTQLDTSSSHHRIFVLR